MKTGPSRNREVNLLRSGLTRVSARERELSSALNYLIGEANCEAALLPTRRTADEWTRAEVCEAVIRCQHAIIVTLRCASELQELEDLDLYSKVWIREALQTCDEHLKLLELRRNTG